VVVAAASAAGSGARPAELAQPALSWYLARQHRDLTRTDDSPMGKLFLHAGVFLAFTFVVFLVCQWFIRYEEQRAQKKGPRW
jgi:hypothetical protein